MWLGETALEQARYFKLVNESTVYGRDDEMEELTQLMNFEKKPNIRCMYIYHHCILKLLERAFEIVERKLLKEG